MSTRQILHELTAQVVRPNLLCYSSHPLSLCDIYKKCLLNTFRNTDGVQVEVPNALYNESSSFVLNEVTLRAGLTEANVGDATATELFYLVSDDLLPVQFEIFK